MKTRYYSSIFLLTLSAGFFLANLLLILNVNGIFENYVESLANNATYEQRALILKVILAGGRIEQFSTVFLIISSVISCVLLYFSALYFNVVRSGLTMKVIFTKEYWIEAQLSNVSYVAPKKVKKKRKKINSRKAKTT